MSKPAMPLSMRVVAEPEESKPAVPGLQAALLTRIVDRAKELVNDPATFYKHMRESGDLKDHLDDFYNPNGYEDYKIHEANAKYVNEHYPYPYRFLAKEMSRIIACRERNKDKGNPKWRQDNKRCD